MSKNITIQEGGIAKQLTVDKLKTNLVSSGTCLWVPEDEVTLGTKTITQNGTYKASDDGYYGYSEVIVSGVGSVSGTDPETGEDVVVSTDPETGEIVETTVPHSIRVVTPPYNQYGIYTNGQAITKDGMEVRALLASGNRYNTPDYPQGLIPNGELTLNPTTATYDAAREQGAEYTSPLLDVPVNAGAPTFDATKATKNMASGIYNGPGTCTRISSGHVVIASASANDTWGYQYYNEDGGPTGSGTFPIAASWTYDNKTVYYTVTAMKNWFLPSTNTNKVQETAWTMIYGTQTGPAGSVQTITVSWPRPLDSKILETTFEILVAPGYTPGGGE